MAKKKKKPAAPTIKGRLVRDKRINISLNESEYNLLMRFYSECKITNKSKFLRDTIMKTVWEKMIDNSTALFSKDEMK